MAPPHATADAATADAPPPRDRRGACYAGLAVVAFALFLYGDLLVVPTDTVVSHINADICSAFGFWRQFGIREILKGNLPLWNPYLFCGTPFVGNVQSALFYPINTTLYALLPLAKAINAEVILHALLAGLSTLAWVRSRGNGWLAGVLSAAIVMAGAPFAYRVILGQLNVIAVFAWLPLTLLAIDKLFQRVSAGWVLVGMLAVSMQLLAGYPPSVFNNACAAGLYCALCMVNHRNRLRTAAALAVMGIGALSIAAAPLAAGYHTMGESLRSHGTSLEFASSWSLPIENLLTLFMPEFFGNHHSVPYWGRWSLWDLGIFIGIGPLFFVAFGAVRAPRAARRFSGVVLLVLLLTALGRYTPFYTFLYYCVPGMSSFRAPSKFLMPALVFAAMLAGLGANEFIARPGRTRWFTTAAVACGAFMLGLALFLQFYPSLLDPPSGLWIALVDSMLQSGESFPWEELTSSKLYATVWNARIGALIGATTCVVVAYLFFRAQRGQRLRAALIAIGIAEVLCFSRLTRETSAVDALSSPELAAFARNVAGDSRVLQAKSNNPNWRRNYPMVIGLRAPWGYDPVMLDRFASFHAFAIGGAKHHQRLVYDVELASIVDPISASLFDGTLTFGFETPGAGQPAAAYPFVTLPPLFRLMRCKYVYFWPETPPSLLHGVRGIHEVRDPFPRFSIYRDFRVVTDREQILPAMTGPDTDLKRTLFLEREPSPRPAGDASTSAPDTVTLIDQSTDALTLDIELASPGILFITEAYSTGWHATALPGSVQLDYEIQPADYAFQGIALAAGHHRLRLEYAPAIVALGIWITALSTACYAAACIGCCYANRRRRRNVRTAAVVN